MPRDFLDDSYATVNRGFLRACACVSRQGAGRSVMYEGLLVAEPKVGAPLELSLAGQKRLRTSKVVGIEPAPGLGVYVKTANSRYLVRRLFG